MEQEQELLQEQPEEYIPRPRRQVWLARIGVAVMVVLLILYYVSIARG